MSQNRNSVQSSTGRTAAAAILAGLALGAAFVPATAEAAAPREAIVFYGDSLTAAYGLDPQAGYPAVIENKLRDAGWEDRYFVVASAVSGETSAGGLARLDWALKAVDRTGAGIGVFMLALGSNDGLRGQSIEAMKDNLSAILTRVRQRNPDAALIVAGMLMPPNMGQAYQQEFRAAFAEVADAHDATLIPFLLEDVAGNPELNLPDRIHPNAKGQRMIAENLWPILKPMLAGRARLESPGPL